MQIKICEVLKQKRKFYLVFRCKMMVHVATTVRENLEYEIPSIRRSPKQSCALRNTHERPTLISQGNPRNHKHQFPGIQSVGVHIYYYSQLACRLLIVTIMRAFSLPRTQVSHIAAYSFAHRRFSCSLRVGFYRELNQCKPPLYERSMRRSFFFFFIGASERLKFLLCVVYGVFVFYLVCLVLQQTRHIRTILHRHSLL